MTLPCQGSPASTSGCPGLNTQIWYWTQYCPQGLHCAIGLKKNGSDILGYAQYMFASNAYQAYHHARELNDFVEYVQVTLHPFLDGFT